MFRTATMSVSDCGNDSLSIDGLGYAIGSGTLGAAIDFKGLEKKLALWRALPTRPIEAAASKTAAWLILPRSVRDLMIPKPDTKKQSTGNRPMDRQTHSASTRRSH